MTDSINVLALVILLSGMAGCSDPDQVPETHRSLPPHGNGIESSRTSRETIR